MVLEHLTILHIDPVHASDDLILEACASLTIDAEDVEVFVLRLGFARWLIIQVFNFQIKQIRRCKFRSRKL